MSDPPTLDETHYQLRIKKLSGGLTVTTKVVDHNHYGQILTSALYEGDIASAPRWWIKHWEFDASGRVEKTYSPTVTSSYDPDWPNSAGEWQGGSSGLRTEYTYDNGTNSLESVSLGEGLNGVAAKISETTYEERDGPPIAGKELQKGVFLTEQKSFLDATTSFDTEFEYLPATSLVITERVTTLPALSASKNGAPGASESKEELTTDGLVVWTRSLEGTLTYYEYDEDRRLLTRQVDAADETAPPTGAPATSLAHDPSNAPLSIETTMDYDFRGRAVEVQSPDTEPERTIYSRLFGGEQVTLSFGDTGPIQIRVTDPGSGKVLHQVQGNVSPRPTAQATQWSSGWITIDDARTAGGWEFHQRTDFEYAAGRQTKTYTFTDANATFAAGKYTVTENVYDTEGRLAEMRDALGGVDSFTYDVLGRQKERRIGLVGGTQLVVSSTEYDDEQVGASTGEGHVVKRFEHVDSDLKTASSTRVTTYAYDHRGRNTLTFEPGGVYSISTYDNLDRITETERKVTASAVLLAKSKTHYDEWSRSWAQETYGVTQTGGQGRPQRTETWYDREGRVIKVRSRGGDNSGGVFQKTDFDALGRVEKSYLSFDLAEPDSSYSSAKNVVGDTVVEEARYEYDDAGRTIFVRKFERSMGATGTGPLDYSGSTAAWVSHKATWYDQAGRVTHSVDYGDYGGNQLTARPSGSPPGSTSATELVTRYHYDPVVLKEDADSTDQSFANTGLLHSVQVFPDISDPNGRKTEYKYDFRGRTITVIGDAKVGGMNRRRDIAYDAEGNVTLRTAWNGVQAQKTEYVYGVTANQDGSIVSAADYLYKIKHPIPSGAGAGNPSTLPVDQEVFGYNRQAERIYRKDQNQTVHNYTFDVRGRQELDHVQAFGVGIDQLVHSIDVDYDLEDRMVKVTSLGVRGVTRNQVTFDYDVWGNVTKVGQERNGPVTGSSPTVDLHYTEEPSTGTVETLRLDKATYPSGIQVWVDYAGTGTLADTISDVLDRPKGRRFSASGQWVYQYGYQGAGRILEKQYFYGPSQNTLERERVLDRFGRTDELGVKVTSSGFYWDRLKYDYNGDSTIASIDRIDQLTYAFDQTYEYDSIGRLVDWKRGLLSGGNISNPSDTQAWQLDPSGNWLTHTLQGTTTNTATFHATNEFDTRNNNSNYASYDSAGSMTVKDAGGYSFKYDAWGRVVQVLGYWGYYNFGTYEYDGLGRRIYKSKYNWSTPREYFYGPSWQVLEEIGENTNTASHWTKYVWGDEYIDELAWRSTLVDGPECIVQDENFNVMTKFDADDGLLASRVRYTPYGIPSQYDVYDTYIVTTDDHYLFTGREWQSDSGIVDYRRRFAGADIGKFVSIDPIGEWGDSRSNGNGFQYCGSYPGGMLDPFGLTAYFIGGAGEGRGTPGAPMQFAMSRFKARYPEVEVEFFTRKQKSQLMKKVRANIRKNCCDPIVLVAHSWGGAVALHSARLLGRRVGGHFADDKLTVDMVVTLDPVSQWDGNRGKSSNVHYWINVYPPMGFGDAVVDAASVVPVVNFVVSAAVGLGDLVSGRPDDFTATTGNRWHSEVGANVNIETKGRHGDAYGFLRKAQAAIASLERHRSKSGVGPNCPDWKHLSAIDPVNLFHPTYKRGSKTGDMLEVR